MPRNLLLISTSSVHGSGYLDYCMERMESFLDGVRTVLFVPYARPSGITYDDYTAKARERFASVGIGVTGIHDSPSPALAVQSAESMFIGGGNTFVLLRQLYSNGLLEAIRHRIAEGMPYMGTSAGANVAGMTIGTTNDMPIVYPPSFDALGAVPFNINPHYLDPDPSSTHRGETRETRISEFHVFDALPVLGLREGAMIHVTDHSIALEGTASARLFRQGEPPEEYAVGARLDFLLQ